MELEAVIGLEIHAQLSTKTKLFCGCDNDAFGAEPNTRVCATCMGFPGVLPVLNQRALEKGFRASAALGCELAEFSKFDRKNYFYPDLPYGFQISQYDKPIAERGVVEVRQDDDNILKIGITRVHLENDAGKLVHVGDGTLCDFNRAGTPLIEIVTEPDLRSPEEAQALAQEIQKILRTVDASNADMEKGMMRFDASISLREKGDSKLYPRTEIKNLNSFVSLFKALKYEIKKQKDLWQKSGAPDKETTVGWLDDEEKTKLLRDKESAHDYRYFAEPNIPPVCLQKEEIQKIKDDLPELPLARYQRYHSQINLPKAEALKISESTETSNFYDAILACGEIDSKKSANLLLSVLLARPDWDKTNITPRHVADVVELQLKGKISSSAGKEILLQAMESGESAEDLMYSLGLEQKSDTADLDNWVTQVIEANPQVVEDIKNGKEKGVQFLIGQVMKISKGSAHPGLVSQIVREKVGVV